jgi:hypothetical protein
MKVRLSSSSLFLPEVVVVNAFCVDFQQVSMVGFFIISERGVIRFQGVQLLVVSHDESVP